MWQECKYHFYMAKAPLHSTANSILEALNSPRVMIILSEVQRELHMNEFFKEFLPDRTNRL